MHIVFENSDKLPVKKYGGTQRILFWLMRELVKLGHKVSLIGHPFSQVQKIGVKLIKNYFLLKDWRKLIPKNTDIVVLFYTPPFKIDYPLLVRIGGNGKVGEKFLPNTIFVSKKHAENHNSQSFVYNGIPLEEYPLKRKFSNKWKDFLFLAKAKWKVKNLSDCLRACKALKKKIHIAGGYNFWDFSSYTRYYGMLEQSKKIPLMEKMDAFLWPVRWHEPFGIAVIEAYSQGLPVICSPYGSLPELVTEKTGIVCNHYQDFFKALSRNRNEFDGQYIRDYCEQNFSAQKMAREYLRYFQLVIAKKKINLHPPYTRSKISSETLLDF